MYEYLHINYNSYTWSAVGRGKGWLHVFIEHAMCANTFCNIANRNRKIMVRTVDLGVGGYFG
jgi:hypothetical protein